MKAHTPGPWVIAGLPNDYPESINADGPVSVASVPRWGPGETRHEAAANARLIAAAPDLLKALQDVEWGAQVDMEDGGYEAGCAWCDAPQSGGVHYDYCGVGRALKKAITP